MRLRSGRRQGNDIIRPLRLADNEKYGLQKYPGKMDLSFRKPSAPGLHRARRDREGSGIRQVPGPRLRPLGPRRIVSNYLKHLVSPQSSLAAQARPYRFRLWQRESLRKAGYTERDVEEWAKILATPDVLEASSALANRVRTGRRDATPLFIFSNLLRRQYIPPRALRALVLALEDVLQSSSRGPHQPENLAFVMFLRLLRHARAVWPASLDRISRMLLDCLPRMESQSLEPDHGTVTRLTHMLNKAMRLIVMPTAREPIRHNLHQETALVRILEFMATHTPTLQISREGYRAVTLLQLAQRKTEKEQQWAELKALSWPPWKEDRTAMDQYITSEDYGLSKAAATLFRMREAGYRPLEWEQTAMIYAGWDVDRTPTIQTLSLFGSSHASFRSGAATWAARIVATRTAQEAWAAFLAYEDKHHEPNNQEVYLAIMSKLWQEERRRHWSPQSAQERNAPAEARNDDDPTWPLFPGDTKEISPLPHSTHLHTYTRSLPPSVYDFWLHARQKGFSPNSYCLAILLNSARTLQIGIRYLENSGLKPRIVAALLRMDQAHDIQSVPLTLLIAFVRLLCRFSKVPMPRVSYASTAPQSLSMIQSPEPSCPGTRLAVVHAIALLEWQRTTHSRPYNVVLHRLSHASALQNLSAVEDPTAPVFKQDIANMSPREQEQQRLKGALTAFRLTQRILDVMSRVQLDLEPDGFRALCHTFENTATAAWALLRDADTPDRSPERLSAHQQQSLEWLRSATHAQHLRSRFRILVGDTPTHPRQDVPPPPLEVPSFVVLHAYIRALGWIADYDGLLQTVRWMATHADVLATRAKQDRNGGRMRRRTFCALRVYLERRWLKKVGLGVVKAEKGTDGDAVDEVGAVLRRLGRGAPRRVVEEVRGVVEGVECWSGWPGEREVEEYLRDARFEKMSL